MFTVQVMTLVVDTRLNYDSKLTYKAKSMRHNPANIAIEKCNI